MPQTDGPIFQFFKETQVPALSAESETCAADSVDGLLESPTSDARPGMLLGQVQSGKTRTFVAAIALALDNGFDVAVVFTKGTKALTRQTVARLSRDLRKAVAAELVSVDDIRTIPDNLTEWELRKKLVIVCKKEDDNLDDLESFFNQYPQLLQRRVLLVDDEADFASVGYRRSGGAVIANVIPMQINSLREQLQNVSFLQVTATPYALYLQPEGAPLPQNGLSRPLRPAFTELVPVHPQYIGGRVYFDESLDPDSVAFYFHVPLETQELEALKTPGTINLDGVLTTPTIGMLRQAVTSFVVGAWIRRRQQATAAEAQRRYSFIVHTETGKRAHQWQASVVTALINGMQQACTDDPNTIDSLVRASYDDLAPSLMIAQTSFPTFEEVRAAFPEEVTAVMTTTVNSERQVEELLDENGQLRLRTPYNIFVGGQILDRGITIDNLIGFFYGRRPKVVQQDTVLQHSRMYGARPTADLAVTRFYTTNGIYNSMRTVHDFDEALRNTIEVGGQDAGVIFLRKDDNGNVIPCSPSKTLNSTIMTVRPGSRQRVPAGFNTRESAVTAARTQEVDALLAPYFPGDDGTPAPQSIPIAVAIQILETIAASFDTSESTWDVRAYIAVLRYLAAQHPDPVQRQQVLCIVRRNRDLARVRPGGRLQDAPDSAVERNLAQNTAPDVPCLLLYRQQGTVEQKWRGAPFWWPVVRAPQNIPSLIYAAND